MSTLEDKSALRREVRARLARVTDARWAEGSREVCARVLSLAAWNRAGGVMLYASMHAEVSVDELAGAAMRSGKRVFSPRIDWTTRIMDAAEVRTWGPGEGGLEPGRQGLRQPGPLAASAGAGDIDLIIVPGLAFDAKCGRLGRGGGFYDRFLGGTWRGVSTVAVALEEQIVERVPREEWDVTVKAVATDARLIEAD